MAVYVLERPVLFQHCDPAGIVFYPRYYEMLNETVETWFGARLGCDFAELHGARGLGIPTVELTTRFLAPSRLGDMLQIALRVEKLGRSSTGLGFSASCAGQARLEMRSTIVCVTLEGGRPRPWPEDIRGAMERELEEGRAHA